LNLFVKAIHEYQTNKNISMKQYQISFVFFLLFLFTFSGIGKAEIKLPTIFGNNMVLQQQTDAAIWGKAKPNKNVKVTTSWDKKSYTAKSDGLGNWSIKVRTPHAGGPFNMVISDGKALQLNDILIGEVWICSGQSNMAMPVSGKYNQPVFGSNKAIATSGNNSIRLFSVELNKSLAEQDDFSGVWKECIPENVANFSATGYFFGQMLQEALGIPIGLICSSWGGTRIEPWMSENALKNFTGIVLPDKEQKGEFKQNTPTVLYNAMIAPMVGLAIRGAIWYQGEANKGEPSKYEKLMSGLILNWRAEWGIGDFPFYFVQIAPYNYGATGLNSAYLREAQLKASFATVNTGMACLLDIGQKDCIHPTNKQAVGERLAYLALAKTYDKKGFEYSGPILKEMKVDGSVVYLNFNHANNGLTSFGKELVNFKVAGKNKVFFQATATITAEGITLFCPSVKEPVAVRYAFEDFVEGELFNAEGLPASSFRTDEWEPAK
jgi:sialate O-acetylesterase